MSIYPQKQNIEIVRGDDYSQQFFLGVDLTGKVVTFTLKTSKYDADSDSKVQIDTVTGLVTLNGAPATNPAWGSITVDSILAGTITLNISHEATDLLRSTTGWWYWDFQV